MKCRVLPPLPTRSAEAQSKSRKSRSRRSGDDDDEEEDDGDDYMGPVELSLRPCRVEASKKKRKEAINREAAPKVGSTAKVSGGFLAGAEVKKHRPPHHLAVPITWLSALCCHMSMLHTSLEHPLMLISSSMQSTPVGYSRCSNPLFFLPSDNRPPLAVGSNNRCVQLI